MLPDRGKGLIFLRMQNNLLRRLSKSLHTVFCGRILCFLSSVFPIAEKSGVNLRGAFNSGNITKFDQFTTFLPTNTDEIERGDSSSSSKDPEKMALQTDAAQMTHPPVNTITAEIKQPVTQIEEIKQPVNPVEEVKKPITPIEEAKQPDDSARAKASKSGKWSLFFSPTGQFINNTDTF
jgi:THO complex subunit 1